MTEPHWQYDANRPEIAPQLVQMPVLCKVETSIDYEGLADLDCQLTVDHEGMHRYEDDEQIVLWEFKDAERNRRRR
jgi:hypothetical protein